MRRTLIVGFVVGSLSAMGIAASVAVLDRTADMPADKAVAFTSPGPVTHVPQSSGPTVVWRDLRPDEGAAADIAVVKQAVVMLLEGELMAGAMPSTVAERRATGPARRAAAAKAMDDIWVPEVAPGRRSEFLSAMDLAIDDPGYLSYTEARLVVSEWYGITTDGMSADVTVLGHEEFRTTGQPWTAGQKTQYQIRLVKTGSGPNGWQMAHKSILFDQTEGE
jgi:hypothetical protein